MCVTGGGGRGCLEPPLNFQIICNIIIRTFVNNLVLSPRCLTIFNVRYFWVVFMMYHYFVTSGWFWSRFLFYQLL